MGMPGEFAMTEAPTIQVALTKKELDLLLPVLEHTRDMAERGHLAETASVASGLLGKLAGKREELLVKIIRTRVDSQPQP
jgi:hypothetical protein